MERSWWYRLTVILLFFGINSSAQILPAVLDLDIYGVTTRRLNLPTAASSNTPNHAIHVGRVNTTQNMTVECWARFNDITTPHNINGQWLVNERIVSLDSFNYQLYYSKPLQRIALDMRNNSQNSFFQSGQASDSTGLNLQSNTWYHVAGVCDCTSIADTCQLTVYINGVAGTTAKFYEPVGRFIPANNSLVIGNAGFTRGTQGTATYGQIDEVRIWDHARTSEQINRYMKKRLRCPESGLVAYYTLNEGSGSTGADCAGTAQNVTLVNNAAFITN
jgi:hypothetical protein